MGKLSSLVFLAVVCVTGIALAQAGGYYMGGKMMPYTYGGSYGGYGYGGGSRSGFGGGIFGTIIFCKVSFYFGFKCIVFLCGGGGEKKILWSMFYKIYV